MSDQENSTNTADAAAASDDWAAAMAEQTQADGAAAQANAGAPNGAAAAQPNYAPAQFQDLQPENTNLPAVGDANLDVILDIPVTISMEIGRSKISIRNLLQLNQGSVVELDRLAGEPMDVLVNNCLIAHGEVVVVNEKFGIRLTDVISAAERVKKLR
ncbi:MAG: flagellar motor switch protein FliN [Pseudomonadota bacterium]